MVENASRIFPVFMVIWFIFGIVSSYLFYFRNDYNFKKTYFKFFVIFTGILFISFAVMIGAPGFIYYYMLPAVILIAYLNIKNTVFCRNCGKTVRENFFSKTEFCPKCASRLREN